VTTGLTYSQYVTQIATMGAVASKSCCVCASVKPIDAFGRLSEAKDGRTYACLACIKIKMTKWRKFNRDRDRAAKNRWAAENKDKLSQKGKKYYAENREKHIAACKKWANANASLVAFRFARRRAAKKHATPKWLTAIHWAQIQEMYDVAAAISVQTGIKHHVDHIFPLQGRGFHGLHVPWNLRVIPASENHQKLNFMPPEHAHLLWDSAP